MKTIFTNGCFDLLHPGHVAFLEAARRLGDRLIVGINSDDSVRALKGPGRPIQSQEERAAMLRSLKWVDEVLIFHDPTPERLLRELRPDVLVKGADWRHEEIAGASSAGRVEFLPLLADHSTTGLIHRIKTRPRYRRAPRNPRWSTGGKAG